MANKYTIETGRGYQGVWKARNYELMVNLATTAVDWSPGSTIYFVDHDAGVQAAPTRPSNSEVVETVDVRVNQRPVLRVPWAAVQLTGIEDGRGDVRAYVRDGVDGLVLVDADNDPYLSEDGDRDD